MNKKLLKEINHFRKLTNLPLIVEEGGRGESTVFKEILNLIFKNEAKYAAEGMFTYINRRGGKVTLKSEVAKNLLERDIALITRAEEIEAYQALHDNMVNKFGASTMASAMNFELKKIVNPVTRETTKRFILDKSFNKTRTIMTNEMEQLERVTQQAQGGGQSSLSKVDLELSSSQLKGMSPKDANTVRNFINEIENATTTVEGRIKLYDALDAARYRSNRRSIDSEIDRMAADSKQKVQPYIDEADIAEQNARRAKAEAEASIQGDKKKLSNMETWKGRFLATAAGAKALVVIIGAILSMIVLGIVIMGVLWVYNNLIKPLGGWISNTTTGGGSLPSSQHNSWNEPGNSGGSKPSKPSKNDDEGSLDRPDNLPNN
jgi:hypothetical protein